MRQLWNCACYHVLEFGPLSLLTLLAYLTTRHGHASRGAIGHCPPFMQMLRRRARPVLSCLDRNIVGLEIVVSAGMMIRTDCSDIELFCRVLSEPVDELVDERF
jgi:hypothetical protein